MVIFTMRHFTALRPWRGSTYEMKGDLNLRPCQPGGRRSRSRSARQSPIYRRISEGGGSCCSPNLLLPKGVGEIDAKKNRKKSWGFYFQQAGWVQDARLKVNWPSVESYNAEIREEADKRLPLRQAGRARVKAKALKCPRRLVRPRSLPSKLRQAPLSFLRYFPCLASSFSLLSSSLKE